LRIYSTFRLERLKVISLITSAVETPNRINLSFKSMRKRFYIYPLLSSLLLVLAFPKIQISWLAWVALVPFLLTLYETKGADSFRAGMVFGFGYFFGTQYWIYHSINHYGGLPFVASLSVVMLLCLYEALYIGVFGLVLSWIIKKRGLPLIAVAPPLWCSLEYLRGHLLTGFPWSSIGYTQSGVLAVVQITDITGIYGVSFLILLINAFFTETWKKRKIEFLSGIAVLLIISIIIIYGFYRINTIQDLPFQRIKIGLVQGNIDQSIKWDSRYRNYVIKTYKELTIKVKREGAELIIWPETALPFYFGYEREFSNDLKEFVRELSLPLLTGTPMVKDFRKSKEDSYIFTISNSAVLLDRDGNVSDIYDKIHLVPFGEYVPLKEILFFIDKVVEGIGDFKRGERYTLFTVDSLKFFTLICYEVIFPSLVRKFRDGDFIVNITNDAWFGRTSGPYQHFEIARIRAVENRIPLVRVANTGITGVVDAVGRVLTKTEIFKRDYRTVDLAIQNSWSFYRIYGDIFSFLNFVIMGIIVLIRLSGGKRR
jgi:apolipoprotein N-acyltransferase